MGSNNSSRTPTGTPSPEQAAARKAAMQAQAINGPPTMTQLGPNGQPLSQADKNRDIWAQLLARERNGTLGTGVVRPNSSGQDRGGYSTSGRGGGRSSSFGGAQRGGGGLY